MLEALNVKQTTTPAYHPESNRVECAHCTLAAILRAESLAALRNWPVLLAPVVMAINTTTHRLTGRTPYELQFGRTAVMPLDMIVPSVDTTTSRHCVAYPDNYVQLLKERAAAAYREVMA